jgi:signal transduction histidine kinase
VSARAHMRRARLTIEQTGEPVRFKLLAAAVFISAVAVVWRGIEVTLPSVSWPTLMVFGGAAALAGLLSIHSHSSAALSLDTPVLLAAGLVFGPAIGGALALIAYIDPREWHRELSLYRAVCNRGQTALSVMAGSYLFLWVGGELGSWPGSLGAGLLALAADISVNYLLVGLMTAARVGTPVGASLAQLQLGPRGLFALMYFAYGLMSVLLAEATAAMGLKGFVVFIVPLVLAKGVFEQSQQVLELRSSSRRQSEALRAATSTLAQERRDERQVLAGELHDEVLPPLFKVHLMGQVLRQDLSAGRLLSLDDDLPELLSATESAQSAVRDVVRGLRGAKIGPGGLEASLKLVAQRLESAGSPKISLDLAHVSASEETQLLCYQLAREALSNAAKHSHASVISVVLKQAEDRVSLVVADDGVGFDPVMVDTTHHFGLSLISERVRAAQGIVDISTGLGSGTVVHASLPVAAHSKAPG